MISVTAFEKPNLSVSSMGVNGAGMANHTKTHHIFVVPTLTEKSFHQTKKHTLCDAY